MYCIWESIVMDNGPGRQHTLNLSYYMTAFKMSVEGKSVCVSLGLLNSTSRMEELQNLWNDA
jgi:hypothetical protein